MTVSVFFILLFLGYVIGKINEKRHIESLIKREKEYQSLFTSSTKSSPYEGGDVDCHVVVGNVVISIDYFKKVSAALRIFFGGNLKAYESLLDRARREAILRMKEDANIKGASIIFNVKLETASIYKGENGDVGSVEVYAYGTALTLR